MEKGVFYSELPERLTKHQFLVVKAFAKKGMVESPISADFMENANIRSSSSMHRTIQSLLVKQLIIKDDGKFRLYDVFLERYLKYTIY